MYRAICLSNPSLNCDGFVSLDDAEQYIKENMCSLCKKDLDNGGYPIDEYGDFVRVTSIWHTNCAAEWETEHYEQ